MQKKYFENELFENITLFNESIDFYEFVDCKFSNCVFKECTLNHCKLSECEFIECQISEINNSGSEINFLSFKNCSLSGINWGLFASANALKEPVQAIIGCNLKYNVFSEMNFKKFIFKGSDITSSTFAECNLTESNFNDCNLSDTEFFKCDICKADYRNAVGYKIDIMSCKMKGAKFSYPEVENLLHSLDIIIE